MSIGVLRPGLLTTVQDLGRTGFQKHGVIISGAMDSYSMRIANLLIGNKEDEAVLEITLIGPSLLFEQAMLIAITGADLSPTINDMPLPQGRPVYVQKGSILQFGSCKSGCRAYIAVAGGFAVQKVMNSKSTYLLGKLGGYKGRALQKNDTVPVGQPSRLAERIKNLELDKRYPFFHTANWYVPSKVISSQKDIMVRVMLGEHFKAFTAKSQERLFTEPYTVTLQSNRMGYRLSGSPLQLEKPFELLSEAVSHGTVQVPPDGNPILLLSDRQTTGGYPRIAQVASVDLSALAQVKPGEHIYFKPISVKEAQQLLVRREAYLRELKHCILHRYSIRKY